MFSDNMGKEYERMEKRKKIVQIVQLNISHVQVYIGFWFHILWTILTHFYFDFFDHFLLHFLALFLLYGQ